MLLKFIIFVIVIFLILRFLSRFFVTMFIGNLSDKISQAQNNYSRDRERHREGDVIINSSKKSDKKYNIREGEYVDFEEIKE